jgi:hypothetical protein
MVSILEPTDRAPLLARFLPVRPESVRPWGRMSPAQALFHCQLPLHVALGELRLRRNRIGLAFGGRGTRQLLAPKNFGTIPAHGANCPRRNLPTAQEFRSVRERELETERERLVQLVERLTTGGPDALTKDPHPFLGRLRVDEWDALQCKHLAHHLQQFGC